MEKTMWNEKGSGGLSWPTTSHCPLLGGCAHCVSLVARLTGVPLLGVSCLAGIIPHLAARVDLAVLLSAKVVLVVLVVTVLMDSVVPPLALLLEHLI